MDKFIRIINENHINPDDIASITAQPAPVVQFRAWRENTLRTAGDYCFSTPYLLACAAYRINPARWQDESVKHNPEIRKFMQRIKFNIIIDEEGFGQAKLQDSRSLQQGIEVTAKGQTFQGIMECVNGACQLPEFRDTDEELIQKFNDNTANVLSPARAKEITQTILELEKLKDVGQLMKMVAP